MTYYFYLKYDNNYQKELFSSFILGICFLFSETFFLTSFIIFILDLIFYYKVFKFKNFFFKILLFLTPLILFIFYLILNNSYEDWLFTNKTFSVLLDFFYKQNIFNYLFSYFLTFVLSYKKILSEPHIFFYFIVFISNILFILFNIRYFFFKNNFKDNFLFFISLVNIILITQSLNNISIFKLITLSSFGIIVLLHLVQRSQDYFIKQTIFVVIISLSLIIFSNETLRIFYKPDKLIKNMNSNLKFIKNQKYSIDTWNNLNDLVNHVSNIKKKCDIEYFVNFTNDAYYYYILNQNIKSLQYFYWFQNIHKNYQNTFYLSLYNNFNRGINKKINEQIKKNNIIFVTDLYNRKKIKFISDDINYDYEFIEFDNYYYKNLTYSKKHGKKILLIPNNCII